MTEHDHLGYSNKAQALGKSVRTEFFIGVEESVDPFLSVIQCEELMDNEEIVGFTTSFNDYSYYYFESEEKATMFSMKYL